MRQLRGSQTRDSPGDASPDPAASRAGGGNLGHGGGATERDPSTAGLGYLGGGDVATAVGVDPGSVRIHQHDGVAEGHGARAVTKGDDIHFAGDELWAPDATFLIGHELAHVVQQRQGAGTAQARRDDDDDTGALEVEADRVGEAVARGERVAGEIDGIARPGSAQRFEPGEHREIGDAATRTRHGQTQTVELAPGYRVSYGDMVAMGGDYFTSIDEMRFLAGRPGKGGGTREELDYVRIVKVHGRKEQKLNFSKEAREAADRRFYRLLASNASHFVNPVEGDEARSTADKGGAATNGGTDPFRSGMKQVPDNAIGNYRRRHLVAVLEAWNAGRAGLGTERALAANAFADHFLTDSFSAGHNRTPRITACAYWNAKAPMFFFNFKGYLGEQLASHIDRDTLLGAAKESYISSEARKTLELDLAAKGVAPFTFGDLVCGAIHDRDNTDGIRVTIGGEQKTIFGDHNLAKGDTKEAAMRAVRASVADVEAAHRLGQANGAYQSLSTLLAPGGLFAAEELIPIVKPDAELPEAQRATRWNHASIDELFADPMFRHGLATLMTEKRSELEEVGEGLEKDYQKEAFKKTVASMAGREIETIRRVLAWVPGPGDGTGKVGYALEYFDRATMTRGGLESLLYPARVALLKDLLRGDSKARAACLRVLATAPPGDALRAIDAVGWDLLADTLGSRFVREFPRRQRR